MISILTFWAPMILWAPPVAVHAEQAPSEAAKLHKSNEIDKDSTGHMNRTVTMTSRATQVEPQKKKSDAAATPSAAEQTSKTTRLDVVLDGIQSFYAQANDLTAQFEQTYTYTVYGRKQMSTGVVYFKKPGMMRWDYQKPTPKVFVADGRTLWVYEPTENQAFRRKLSSSQLPVALTFMSGKGRLRDEFSAKLKQDTADGVVIELIPKRNEGDYKRIDLTCDATTFAVKSSLVVDPVNNTNKITFRKLKLNQGLPDKGFQFSLPKGVRLITDPRQKSP